MGDHAAIGPTGGPAGHSARRAPRLAAGSVGSAGRWSRSSRRSGSSRSGGSSAAARTSGRRPSRWTRTGRPRIRRRFRPSRRTTTSRLLRERPTGGRRPGTAAPRAPRSRPVRAWQAGRGGAARARPRAHRQARFERGPVRPVSRRARGDRAQPGTRRTATRTAAASASATRWPRGTGSRFDEVTVCAGRRRRDRLHGATRRSIPATRSSPGGRRSRATSSIPSSSARCRFGCRFATTVSTSMRSSTRSRSGRSSSSSRPRTTRPGR